jgi:NTP pyrophosphatase (non-canonical NTP hydrolase)
MIEFIRDNLSEEELLAQLAEEAAELGHAALKMRRVMDGRNPTPVRLSEAYANLQEEIADVQLVLEVLGLDGYAQHAEARQAKLDRWVGRLREGAGGSDGC